MEAKCKVVIGGTGGDPGGCPCPSCSLLEAGDKYGGMANGVAIDSKWDGTGCAGMVRCPFPVIWSRSPGHTQIL